MSVGRTPKWTCPHCRGRVSLIADGKRAHLEACPKAPVSVLTDDERAVTLFGDFYRLAGVPDNPIHPATANGRARLRVLAAGRPVLLAWALGEASPHEAWAERERKVER